MPVGLVGDNQRDARREVDQHARVELEIGVDRADLQRACADQLGKLAALRPSKGKIEPARDAALEHGQMIGQCQDRLHHVQIVHARRVDIGKCRGEEIRLLLIVAFDGNAVAGFDERFEQLGRTAGWTDFSAISAEGHRPRQALAAIGRPGVLLFQHVCSPSFDLSGLPMSDT